MVLMMDDGGWDYVNGDEDGAGDSSDDVNDGCNDVNGDNDVI